MKYLLRIFIVVLLTPGLALAKELPRANHRHDSLAKNFNHPNSMPVNSLSQTQEKELAKQFLAMLRKHELFLNDPVVVDYVQTVGHRLGRAAQMSQKLHFFVIANDTVNAFAGPDGYIGVNTGLFRITQNEGELAGVLAHEIAHVRERHLMRMLALSKENRIPNLLGAIGAIAIGIINPLAGIGAFTAMTAGYVQNLINYTRAHEKDADRIGMKILYRANYNPFEMPKMFERLAQNERYFPNDIPVYLRTHPHSTERISDSENRALDYPKKKYRQEPFPFLLIKKQIEVDVSVNPNKNLANFHMDSRTQANKYVKMADEYGEALAFIKLRQPNKAIKILRKLIAQEPDEIIFQYTLGKCYQSKNQLNQAAAIFKQAYELQPDYYPIILAYGNVLIDNKKPKQAKQFLQAHLHQFRSKTGIYYALAKAQAHAGFEAESHITQAKLYQILQDPLGAKLHLEIALKDKKISADDRFRAKSMLQKLKQ
ncbi:MAG: M48 family metalloprotease [Pseudomonadota bacterium]